MAKEIFVDVEQVSIINITIPDNDDLIFTNNGRSVTIALTIKEATDLTKLLVQRLSLKLEEK